MELARVKALLDGIKASTLVFPVTVFGETNLYFVDSVKGNSITGWNRQEGVFTGSVDYLIKYGQRTLGPRLKDARAWVPHLQAQLDKNVLFHDNLLGMIIEQEMRKA